MRVALESRRTRAALTLLAGSLPALAFPAPALWWLAPVALVPWLLLARSARTPRGAAVTGWLGGTAYMLAVHHWLLPSLHIFILVLAALLGLLWAPWGWTVRRLLRGRPRPASLAAAVFLLPAAWLLAELVRSWQYLGGPWGLFGASQWQVAPALRLVSVGGVWLVSFLLVAVNTCVAALVAVPTARRGAVTGLVGAAVVVGSVSMWAPRPERTGELRVAVVQPGALKSPQKRLERSEELTRKLADSSQDLVVWGESSVGYDLGAKPELRKRLAALSAEVGADLLVNVDARREDAAGISKTSVLIGPGGPVGERYDKMRLVPFGEYVPARQVLGWATSVGKAAHEDRVRGTEPVLMEAGGTVFGPLICFETAFPDMSRHLVREGARLLVAQTATGTFQDSWAPQQHASLAALRAAETGRPMVHGTLTGVSAVYGPRGEPVGERLGTDRAAASVYPVPLASGTTLYVRFGDWILQLAMTALVAFFVVEAVRTLRSRHDGPERGAGPGQEPYAEADAPSYAGAAAMRRNRRH